MRELTASAGRFDHPPVIDFADPSGRAETANDALRVLKTHTRTVVTLAAGKFRARETIWHDPTTEQPFPSATLRQLVAPGCNYGYDVLVYVGRALFLESQPTQQVMAQLAQRGVSLSASTVAALGRRFIILLAMAHRQRAPQLKAAMALQGGYVLHLDATYEDKSPLLMTGIDAVMEIVLGNLKLPSEKATGIVPFLRQLKTCFGPPLALVHDMSKGIINAIAEVFPDQPDYICHLHFLRDRGKDLFGTEYDRLRQRLQSNGTQGQLRVRLRDWQKALEADPQLRPILQQLPDANWPAAAPAQAPLLAATLLAHYVLAGLDQGQGYGFPFDRPLLTLARRAQEVAQMLLSLTARHEGDDWRQNLPFHHLLGDLKGLVEDRPLRRELVQMETKIACFEQLRQTLRIAPADTPHGLNHDGEVVVMATLEKQVQTFTQEVRARPDYAGTPAFQKMLEQIARYGPKLFAAPLQVDTPQGPRLIQPQRTNNLMERFFRDFKRDCRRKTGSQALGRVLRTMLADTPLVKNLRNNEYLKILLHNHPNLESLFAQFDPATVREELHQAQQNPEKTPRAVQKFIANLTNATPIKKLLDKFKSNRIS